jgi:hypothetical protein
MRYALNVPGARRIPTSFFERVGRGEPCFNSPAAAVRPVVLPGRRPGTLVTGPVMIMRSCPSGETIAD